MMADHLADPLSSRQDIDRIDLPLNVDSYDDELASEVLAAVIDVVRAEPITSNVEEALFPGREPLPDQAPRIIGISGYPRSGKDVAADYLIGKYASVVKVNFSDPIISEVNDFLSPFGHQINEGNKSQPIYRSLLQSWGTARRVERENYWVDSLRERIKDLGSDYRLVVVCGLRALSDAQLIDQLGGRHWRIHRPGNSYKAEHAIERKLDNLGDDQVTTIDNPDEGNFDRYYANIESALAKG